MSTSFKTFLIALIALMATLRGSGADHRSDYSLRTFTTAEGLSYNWVQSICQDKTGFLWIATWDGLSRFDGYEFKNYTGNPPDSLSLPYFSLDKVVVDRFNNVMVVCQNRPISIYNRAIDRFEQLKVNGEVLTSFDIHIDSQQNTWLVGLSGLFFSSGKENNFRKIALVDSNNSKFSLGGMKPLITVDNLGGFWLYTTEPSEINIYRGKSLSDSTIQLEPVRSIFPEKNKLFDLHNIDVIDIYHSKSGKIWLFSKYGLFLFNKSANKYLPFQSSVDPDEFSGKPYFIWLNYPSGINIIDTRKKEYHRIPSEEGALIETAYFDCENNLWAGNNPTSLDKFGLTRYLKTPEYFKHYLTGKNENGFQNQVSTILKDRYNNLWVGIKNLNYLFQIKPDGQTNKVAYLPKRANSSFPVVKSFAQDSSGIWLGCSENNLLYYPFKTRKWQSIFSPPVTVDTEALTLGIHTILRNKKELLINGSEGIVKYDPISHEISLKVGSYSKGTGFTMIEDGSGGYWIGSWSAAIFHFNAELEQDYSLRFGDRHDIIEHICPGDKEDVWVALQGGGLGHIFLKSKEYEILTTTNGLINNVLHSILKDKTGRLWITTNKGLSCYDPISRRFRNFGLEDGLKMEEFNDDSYFQTKEGEFFFGGIGGMISFYPERIPQEDALVHPLVITELSVSGLSRKFDKAIYDLKSIFLNKGDDNFQVSFACLNYKEYQNINYRYRLRGASDVWRSTNQKNRSISFFNLKPGSYQLDIEASGKNAKWDSKTFLQIEIPYRIYEFLWFKIALILLVMAIPVSWIIFYIKDMRIRAKLEQEEMKMEVLRAQMNPHFIFNSLNSINYFISKNDKVSANNYISDFSRLIRTFLNNLSYDFVPMESEFQLLRDYLNMEHLRFGDKFNYSFVTAQIEDTMNWFILSGIVQPFIENAIWHGMNGLENRVGQINVYFQLMDSSTIRCIIEDDGIGRTLSGEYRNQLPGQKSRGTDIVRERLRFQNIHRKANCQVLIEDLYADRKESGTRVVVDIPVKIMNNTGKNK